MQNSVIRTTYEKSIVMNDVQSLLNHLYDTEKVTALQLLKEHVGEFSYEYLTNSLASKGITYININPISIKTYLEDIQHELANLNEVRMTLAISPDDELLNNIHQWLLKNVAPNVIINLRIDRSILGGAIVSINGHYHNGSINKKLATYFSNKRDSLNEHRKIEELFIPKEITDE